MAQLNAKKDLCVSQAPICHGPACPWSWRARRSQAGYGNNRLILRMKVVLYAGVQEALGDPLGMKEGEQVTQLL